MTFCFNAFSIGYVIASMTRLLNAEWYQSSIFYKVLELKWNRYEWTHWVLSSKATKKPKRSRCRRLCISWQIVFIGSHIFPEDNQRVTYHRTGGVAPALHRTCVRTYVRTYGRTIVRSLTGELLRANDVNAEIGIPTTTVHIPSSLADWLAGWLLTDRQLPTSDGGAVEVGSLLVVNRLNLLR